MFYPQRDVAYEPSLYTDIVLWFPGIAWFYYLFNGYPPRTINHFNPVKNFFEFGKNNFSLYFFSV